MAWECIDFVCDHDDTGIDILSGRVTCHLCGEIWYETSEAARLRKEAERAEEALYNETKL